MGEVWGRIVAVGALLTIIGAAPFLIGLMNLPLSMEAVNDEIVQQAVNLAVGAVKAMVPLTIGGALVFLFFQFAAAQA